MAQECNNQEAREAYSTKGNSFKVPITNVRIISKIINALISLPNLPKPPIPRSLILIGSTFRPGINSASMTARFLQEKKRIAPTSPLPSGGENLDNIIQNLVFKTVHDELVENAKVIGTNSKKVQVILPDGTIGTILPGGIETVSVIT
jgi:hypothetical protein